MGGDLLPDVMPRLPNRPVMVQKRVPDDRVAAHLWIMTTMV